MKVICSLIGLISFMFAFTDHLGPERLKRVDALLRRQLTPKGFIEVPGYVFKKSVDSMERFVTSMGILAFFLLAYLWGRLVIGVPRFGDPYITVLAAIGGYIGKIGAVIPVVGEIIAVILVISLALVLGVIFPLFVFVIIITVIGMVIVYVMFGFLLVGKWAKDRFGLSGSFIKISGYGLAALAATIPIIQSFVQVLMR